MPYLASAWKTGGLEDGIFLYWRFYYAQLFYTHLLQHVYFRILTMLDNTLRNIRTNKLFMKQIDFCIFGKDIPKQT